MFRREGNTRGIISMLIAMGAFGMMDAVIKLLSVDMPPMQIAALRGLVTIPLLAVYMWRRGSFHSIVRIKWPLQMVRGVLAIAMLWAFSVGIKSLAMTQAYTIFFIAPMLISILAWPLLGERTSRVRWIALCLGLIGILIALRPQTEGMVSWGGLA
ncbi:MAG: DMT family transporter, partial [Burkholderiaceae bacterium]|nr:DMT family transporter [Burkholderiaceae bacterium]